VLMSTTTNRDLISELSETDRPGELSDPAS
jgi:hypothetical protein